MTPDSSMSNWMGELVDRVASYPHFHSKDIATFGSRAPFAWRDPKPDEPIEELKLALAMHYMVYGFEKDRPSSARDFACKNDLIVHSRTALDSLEKIIEKLPSGRLADRLEKAKAAINESMPDLKDEVRKRAIDLERKFEQKFGILGEKDAERRLELRFFAVLKAYVELPNEPLYKHVNLLCLHLGIPSLEGDTSDRIKQAVWRASKDGNNELIPRKIAEHADLTTAETIIEWMARASTMDEGDIDT